MHIKLKNLITLLNTKKEIDNSYFALNYCLKTFYKEIQEELNHGYTIKELSNYLSKNTTRNISYKTILVTLQRIKKTNTIKSISITTIDPVLKVIEHSQVSSKTSLRDRIEIKNKAALNAENPIHKSQN